MQENERTFDEQELEELEKRWNKACIDNNEEELRQILAPNFVFTDTAGRIYHRDVYIQYAINDEDDIGLEELLVIPHVFGTVGAVISYAKWKCQVYGKPANGYYCYTDTFFKGDDGNWKAIASLERRVTYDEVLMSA